jgi:hypothetical protein
MPVQYKIAHVYKEIASQNIFVNINQSVRTEKKNPKNTCHKILKRALIKFAGMFVTQHTSTIGVT